MSPGFRVWQTNPGNPVEVTEDLKDGEVWLDSTRISSLRKDENRLTAAFFDSGVVVIATVHPHQNQYYIDFRIQISSVKFSGRTKGFVGNLDGDSTNEFYRRGSTTPLSNSIGDRQLLEHLKTCKYTCMYNYYLYVYNYHYVKFQGQVSREESLFLTYEDNINLDFIPIFADEIDYESIPTNNPCKGNAGCLFDYAVTNNMELASNTLSHDKIGNKTKEALSKGIFHVDRNEMTIISSLQITIHRTYPQMQYSEYF